MVAVASFWSQASRQLQIQIDIFVDREITRATDTARARDGVLDRESET